MNTNLTTAAAQRAAAENARTRQSHATANAEYNARQRLERADAMLAEARKIKGARGEALAACFAQVVSDGREAFRKYDGFVEILATTEADFRAASVALGKAESDYLLGSIDPETALQHLAALEVARSAFRVRDRELAAAKRPATVPEIGPPQFDAMAAEKETDDLIRIVRTYGLDMEASTHRFLQDARRFAQEQAAAASPSVAVLWALYESRRLSDEARLARQAELKSTKTDGAAEVEEEFAGLRVLFDFRWAEYEKAQAAAAKRLPQ